MQTPDHNLENGMRVIKTARDERSINRAVGEGYWPLVKPVIPSSEIRTKFAVLQHRNTGAVKVISDFRSGDEPGFERVIDYTFHYPYHFPSPFAAYLIPTDLAIGERVWLEDLIEDFVGIGWNQGDTYRLASSKAIWTGKDFEIEYDHSVKRRDIIVG